MRSLNFDYDSSAFLQLTNEEAVDWVKDEFGEELKKLIFTYVENHEITEHLFQEVLDTIYHQFKRFKAEYSVKLWIFRIAVKKSKSFLRFPFNQIRLKEKRKTEMDFHSADSKLNSIKSIFNLPLQEREVLILHDFYLFSAKEISEILSVRQSKVHARMESAYQKLKDNLGEGTAKLTKNDYDKFIEVQLIYAKKNNEWHREKNINSKRYLIPTIALCSVIFIGFLVVINLDDTAGNDDIDDAQATEEEDELVDDVEQGEIEENHVEEVPEEEIVEPQFEWEEVNSREEVDNFYSEVVPRLHEAEEYGLITEINETATIGELDLELHIEKMWHTSNGIYFFYSIEYDERIHESDYLDAIFSIRSNEFGHEMYGIRVGEKGLIFDNKFYQVVKTEPLNHLTHDVVEFDEEQISLGVTLYIDDRIYATTDAIEVVHSYDRELEEQYKYGIPVEKRITKNGITIDIDRIEVGLAGYELYVDIINERSEHYLNNLYAFVEADTGEERFIYIYEMSREDDQEYKFAFELFNKDTTELNITFDSASYTSDDIVEFSFDVSQYDEEFYEQDQTFEQPIDLVAEVMYTEVYIDHYILNDEGMVVPFWFRSLHDEINLDQHMSVGTISPGFEDFPNMVRVTNEEDQTPRNVLNRRVDIGDENITIDKYFVIDSEEIHIEWLNLWYDVLIDETVVIDLE